MLSDSVTPQLLSDSVTPASVTIAYYQRRSVVGDWVDARVEVLPCLRGSPAPERPILGAEARLLVSFFEFGCHGRATAMR
jgi:hypothetical protein